LKHVPPAIAGVNGELIAITVMSAGALAALLLPFIAGHTARARRVVVWAGAAALVFMALMTGLALSAVAP
jgi:hypothetical protein